MSNLVNITARSPGPGTPPFEDMVWVPGGTFLMGSDRHAFERDRMPANSRPRAREEAYRPAVRWAIMPW